MKVEIQIKVTLLTNPPSLWQKTMIRKCFICLQKLLEKKRNGLIISWLQPNSWKIGNIKIPKKVCTLLKNYFQICTSISAAVCLNFLITWQFFSGAIYDTNYETFKVKEQKFKMFMEDYPQVKFYWLKYFQNYYFF